MPQSQDKGRNHRSQPKATAGQPPDDTHNIRTQSQATTQLLSVGRGEVEHKRTRSSFPSTSWRVTYVCLSAKTGKIRYGIGTDCLERYGTQKGIRKEPTKQQQNYSVTTTSRSTYIINKQPFRLSCRLDYCTSLQSLLL